MSGQCDFFPRIGDMCVVRGGVETRLRAGMVVAGLPSGESVIIAGKAARLGPDPVEEVHRTRDLKGLWGEKR